MDPLTVSDTYGQALYDAAASESKVKEIGEELQALTKLFGDEPDLKRLFLVPTLAAENKKAAAKKIFEGRISKELLNFLYVLIDRSRVGAWDEIARKYARLVDAAEGFSKGVLYTVVPVTKEQLARFEEEAGKAVEKRVKLENHIDKTILGGAVLYVDGKLVDMSIRARLEQLRKRMLA